MFLPKEDDDVIVESESIEYSGSDDDEDSIYQLRVRREELAKKVAEQVCSAIYLMKAD